MCNCRNATRIKIYGKANKVRLDSCIAKEVKRANNTFGFKTVASCCGHGIFHPTIIAKFYGNVFMDINTEIIIPFTKTRCRNFYKLDKKSGLYFIPIIEDYYTNGGEKE